MRISLVQISLLRFFKTFHKYLPDANYFISAVFWAKLIYPLDLLKPNRYIKLNTKIQNIFCRLNENLTTFYTL